MALSGCGSEPLAPPTPATLLISGGPLAFTLVDDSRRLSAAVRDQHGALMEGVLIGWSTSDIGVATVSPTGVVFAVGNGSATIRATAGAATAVITVSVADPDEDKDGIMLAADACPTEPETFNGWLDQDGCPDRTSELYEFVRLDVEAYWAATFTNSNLVYDPILLFAGYDESFASPCGTIPLENAVYCVVNYGVYYHTAFMDRYIVDVGDMAPAFIVSHEIGHHVTFLLRYFNPAWRAVFPGLPHFPVSNKQSELMADCFGGAWVASADRRGLLEEGDGEETMNTLISVGDTSTPWFSSEGHGTSQQRLLAMLVGVVDGPSGCVDPSFFAAFPADSPMMTPAPPSPLKPTPPQHRQ